MPAFMVLVQTSVLKNSEKSRRRASSNVKKFGSRERATSRESQFWALVVRSLAVFLLEKNAPKFQKEGFQVDLSKKSWGIGNSLISYGYFDEINLENLNVFESFGYNAK